jgi:tetratricopeptide (TPR) repeat protein
MTRTSLARAVSRTPLARALTLVLLATLAACTTLQGPQRPAPSSRPSGAGAPPPAESPNAPGPGAANGAPAPEPAPPSGAAPARPPSETSGATQALLAQSRAAREAGSYAQASATIERALRIAPSDPNLWVELGEIELASGNPSQAATLARKALTLAANDSVAVADAQKLLRAAGGH